MKVVGEPLRCPKCGSTDIADIAYDPSPMTEELLNQIRGKKTVIRTGAHKLPVPYHYCNTCGYEW